MTKIEFFKNLRAMYLVLNAADSDSAEAWTAPALAGSAGCGHIDAMIADFVKAGVISQEDAYIFIESF